MTRVNYQSLTHSEEQGNLIYNMLLFWKLQTLTEFYGDTENFLAKLQNVYAVQQSI